MSLPNVFEGLHEAYIRDIGITLSPKDVDLLFELLDERIFDANLHYMQSAHRRARHRAQLKPDEHLRPEDFVSAYEIAQEHGIDYDLFRTALQDADPSWHQDGEAWIARRGGPHHQNMLNVLRRFSP